MSSPPMMPGAKRRRVSSSAETCQDLLPDPNSQFSDPDGVENDLAGSHGDHEDDRGVNASTQRRPMPVCPAERSGQPGEKRQGRDRVDRREERSKILADFN